MSSTSQRGVVHETHYESGSGQSPYTQAAPGISGSDVGRTAQQYASQAQQAGQQAMGGAQQKASDLSQRASESAQYAADQLKATGERVFSEAKATMRHPSRASPYLIPALALLLICGASIVPLSLMAGKGAKDKLASAGYSGDYGRGYYGGREGREGSWMGGGDTGSYVSDKLHQAKESIFGHPSYADELRYRTDDRSFTDKLLGRKSSVEEAGYQGGHLRDEMVGHGYGIGDYLRSAKDRVLGGKETAEETGAGGSEFILQSIDALSDKLHQLRRQYVGRTREEKPSGWVRSTWDSIMDGMDRLRSRMMRG